MNKGDTRTVGAEPSLSMLLSQIAEEGKEVAHAEIAVAKAKAGFAVTRYKNAVIFFAAAVGLAASGFIALLVGLIMTLATVIGPGLATLAVVGVVTAIAAILATIGRQRLSAKDDI